MSREWKILIESKLVHFFTLFVWQSTNWGITTCNTVLRPLYSPLLFTVRQKGVLEENNTNINNWLEFGKCYGTTWSFKLLSFVVAVATVFFLQMQQYSRINLEKKHKHSIWYTLSTNWFILLFVIILSLTFFFFSLKLPFCCISAFFEHLLHY